VCAEKVVNQLLEFDGKIGVGKKFDLGGSKQVFATPTIQLAQIGAN